MAWSISNAMMKDYENSLCSQAQEAASSAVTCSDGAPSAPSNTTRTPDQFYWPDKTTEHSRLSRFGMMCAPLTESRGEDLLTWFRAGFPARTLAQLAKGQDSTASEADCGVRWQGSLARYDHAASLWRTAQSSLVEGLDVYSETWPRWGSMRNGASYLRPIPAHLICESVSGLWQTPVADDAVERKAGKWNSRGEPKLSAEVKMWPTPNTIGFRSDGELLLLSRRLEDRGEFLAMSSRAANSKRERAWPTPSASKGSSQAALTRKSGASRENDRLDHAVMASDSGQLSPEWVEWLMGWPIGLTALKPLETARFHEWQQQHGGF